MDNTDEDPVVHEIDVVLSKQLLDRLYLFQYPYRPATMPYDDAVSLGARIKPVQHKIEVDIAVKTHGPNYNRRKGVEIAGCADGNRAGTVNALFSGEFMDKQVLSSTSVECDSSRYAIGVQCDGILYLTPIKTVVQMRPGLKYWDAVDATTESARAKAAAERAVTNNSGDISQDEEEARPLLAKFARHESQEAKARREASYAYLKRCHDDEAWVKLRYHSVENEQAIDEKRLLYGEHSRPSASTVFGETSRQYLQKIVPRPDAVDAVTSSTDASQGSKVSVKTTTQSTAGLPLNYIRRLPTSDQIRTILVNVNVINFLRLLSLVSHDAAVADVLLVVEQEAYLVQGCWVVKSSRLYPEKTVSGFDGKVSSETLCRARNYILWRFTLSHCLTRKEVSEVLAGVPVQDQQIMLEQLGVRCGRDGWRFSHEFDLDFVREHPEVAARQGQLWEKMSQSFYTSLPIDRLTIAHAKVYTPPVLKEREEEEREKKERMNACIFAKIPESHRRSDSRNNSTITSNGWCASHVTEAANTSDIAIDVDIGMELMSDLSSSFVEEVLKSASRDDEILMKDITDVVSDVNCLNGYLPTTIPVKQEPNDAAFHESVVEPELQTLLAAFAREKLQLHSVLSVNDLKDMFSMRLTELPPGDIMGSGVSDFLLERAMIDAGAVKLGACNARREPLYASQSRGGDPLDAVREAVIALITIKSQFRITALRSKLGDEAFSDEDIRKVLREYCESGGGSWHVKGTKS